MMERSSVGTVHLIKPSSDSPSNQNPKNNTTLTPQVTLL